MKEPLPLNYQRFTLLEGDMDYRTYERVITGRITKSRWKIISKLARRLSNSFHCGCPHDCCGCLSSQYIDVNYQNGETRLTLTQSFNY